MITAISRCAAVIVLALLCWVTLPVTLSAQAQPPEQADEYTPIDQLPPSEQLPAARLLVAAYSFVMVALFLYVVSVARRLTAVQREVERLEADVKRAGRT